MKTEVLYGFHPVFEALNARKRSIYRVFLAYSVDSVRMTRVLSLIRLFGIKYEFAESYRLKSMAKQNNHQGFLALVSPLPIVPLKEILEQRDHVDDSRFLVLLDSIVDPHNLGAIIRTAYCSGVSGIVLTKNRACFPTPTVSKVSAGALEHIPISRVINLSNTIKMLKKIGFWVAGIQSVDGAISVFEVDMKGQMAIVMGGEEKGIRLLVSKQCDFHIKVPMLRGFDSLNASVAAGVVLYEKFRQRLNC